METKKKLSDKQVIEIYYRYIFAQPEDQYAMAAEFKVNQSTINRAINERGPKIIEQGSPLSDMCTSLNYCQGKKL